MTELGAGDSIVVATTMPLSDTARADLSAQLGPGYVVVDIKKAPPTTNIVLTTVVSGQLIGVLRATFPEARILLTELHDAERGIRYAGPVTRVMDTGPDGYFVTHDLESLSPIVQQEAQLQLTGSTRRSAPMLGGRPMSEPVSEPAGVLPEREVIEAALARAAALAVGDAEHLTALLHPDFRWTSHVGETYDREAYVRRNTGGHTVWRSQELVDPAVVVVGDTAVLHAHVTDVVLTADGEPAAFRMPMTQTWVREDGTWRCLAGHAGPRVE
ncbi:nuclear transport factor 2 family protein [Nocardioides sp.]|uniref:nuclear transport factor 2 family protein n=1 Tax=Nocardioides sp. TaxID=35761 RepID=UPI00286A2EAE|nr:nuclear transport factor 2 family protein [Nocardioides sp.]